MHLCLPVVPPHMRVTSSENPVFRLSKPLQFQTWTSWNHQPYLFWHDDFAVGDFLFFLFFFCNSQNWFGLILNGFQTSVLCFILKRLACAVSALCQSQAFHSRMAHNYRSTELTRWKPTLSSTSDSEAEQKVSCHCNRVQNGPL